MDKIQHLTQQVQNKNLKRQSSSSLQYTPFLLTAVPWWCTRNEKGTRVLLLVKTQTSTVTITRQIQRQRSNTWQFTKRHMFTLSLQTSVWQIWTLALLEMTYHLLKVNVLDVYHLCSEQHSKVTSHLAMRVSLLYLLQTLWKKTDQIFQHTQNC